MGAEFSYNSSGGNRRSVNEYEPLGQEVSIDDPAGLPDPPPNESVSHWMDMEWQCEDAALQFYDKSVGTIPWHCDWAMRNDLGRKRESPSKIIEDRKKGTIKIYWRSSTKKPRGEKGDFAPTLKPASTDQDRSRARAAFLKGNFAYDNEGGPNPGRGSLDMGEIPGTDVSEDGISTNIDPKPESRDTKSEDCNHWVGRNYSLLKPLFEQIWKKHLGTYSDKNPNGLEMGGVISLHPEILTAGGRNDTAVDHYTGTTREMTMGWRFDEWVIEQKRIRGFKGWLSIVVHTHGPPEFKYEPSGRDRKVSKTSGGEAVITQSEIGILVDGKVICRIARGIYENAPLP